MQTETTTTTRRIARHKRIVRMVYDRIREDVPLTIKTPDAAYDVFAKVGELNSANEHHLTLYLDGQHHLIGTSIDSKGSSTEVLIPQRSILGLALQLDAVAFLSMHNHPSGRLTFSPEDQAVAQRLFNAGALVGLQMVDALVVTTEGYISMKCNGQGPWHT